MFSSRVTLTLHERTPLLEATSGSICFSFISRSNASLWHVWLMYYPTGMIILSWIAFIPFRWQIGYWLPLPQAMLFAWLAFRWRWKRWYQPSRSSSVVSPGNEYNRHLQSFYYFYFFTFC